MTFRVPDDMIERAARAICLLQQVDRCPYYSPDRNENAGRCLGCKAEARAALEAAYWPHPAALALEAEANKKKGRK